MFKLFLGFSLWALHKPLMRMMKKVLFFTNFRVFLIVLDHANACASMHSLVEIHNKLPSITLGRTTQFSPTHMVGLHYTSRSSSLTPISLRGGNPYFKIKCWKGACEFKEFHFLNNYKPISWVTRIWVLTFISHDLPSLSTNPSTDYLKTLQNY